VLLFKGRERMFGWWSGSGGTVVELWVDRVRGQVNFEFSFDCVSDLSKLNSYSRCLLMNNKR